MRALCRLDSLHSMTQPNQTRTASISGISKYMGHWALQESNKFVRCHLYLNHRILFNRRNLSSHHSAGRRHNITLLNLYFKFPAVCPDADKETLTMLSESIKLSHCQTITLPVEGSVDSMMRRPRSLARRSALTRLTLDSVVDSNMPLITIALSNLHNEALNVTSSTADRLSVTPGNSENRSLVWALICHKAFSISYFHEDITSFRPASESPQSSLKIQCKETENARHWQQAKGSREGVRHSELFPLRLHACKYLSDPKSSRTCMAIMIR